MKDPKDQILAAYAHCFGPVSVSMQIDLPFVAVEYDRHSARAKVEPKEHSDSLSRHLGVLLIMAARHALSERNPAVAFAYASVVKAIAHFADVVHVETAGSEIAMALSFEPDLTELRENQPRFDWNRDMREAVGVMMQFMREPARDSVDELLRRAGRTGWKENG